MKFESNEKVHVQVQISFKIILNPYPIQIHAHLCLMRNAILSVLIAAFFYG